MKQMQLPCGVSSDEHMSLMNEYWKRPLTKGELLKLIEYEEWWLTEKGWACYSKRLVTWRKRLEEQNGARQ